jgi:hypothetical protein
MIRCTPGTVASWPVLGFSSGLIPAYFIAAIEPAAISSLDP